MELHSKVMPFHPISIRELLHLAVNPYSEIRVCLAKDKLLSGGLQFRKVVALFYFHPE
jgi:hypothetical protein